MTRTHLAPSTEWKFADLADWYFAHYAANNLKESTQYNYRYIANRILLPLLGDVPLKDFNNIMLTEWFSGLDYTPSYCKTIFVALRSMFTVALRNGYLDRHPCDYVILSKVPPKIEEKAPSLNEDQARELLVTYYEGDRVDEMMDFMRTKAYRPMD